MDLAVLNLLFHIWDRICGLLGKVARGIFERDKERRREFAAKILTTDGRRQDEILECARECLLGAWFNRLLHMRMCKVLSSETIDAKTFWTIFQDRRVIANVDKFICKANRIVNRRDDDGFPFAGAGSLSLLRESPTYSEDCQQLISMRFSSEVSKWAYGYFFRGKSGGERKDRQAEMLVLGQMSVSLASKLILSTVQAVPVRSVRVRFFGCTEYFEQELVRELPTKRDSVQRLGKLLTIEFGNKYSLAYPCDIVIVSHYWQHRSSDEIDAFEENSRTHPCSLQEGGLYVWDSAISRDPDEDEYVCEGFHSKDVKILSRKDRVMNKEGCWCRPPGTSLKNARRLMVRYDFGALAKRIGTEIYRRFPMAIEWKSMPGVDDKTVLEVFSKTFCAQIGSSMESVTFSAACSVNEAQFGDDSYRVMRIKAVAKSGSPECWVFVAARGKTYEMPGRSASNDRYFIYLAGEVRTNEGDLNQRGVKQLLKDIGDNLAGGDLQLSDCSSDGMRAAVVKRAAHEWDKKRYLLVYERLSESDGMITYVSLPTRRYLTKLNYDLYLKAARECDVEKTAALRIGINQDEARCFRPVSVTALVSYRHLKESWARRHLIPLVSERYGEAFFYKIHHSCDEASFADLSKVFPEGEKELAHNLFSIEEANINRDEYFNQLPMGKRLCLLAPMNVHNVFMIAQKEKMSSHNRVKGTIASLARQFLRYLLCNVVSLSVDLAVMVASYKLALHHVDCGVYWAAVIGFCAGLVMSYCTAMWFVFVSPSEHNKVCSLTAFGWFAVLGLFGLGLVEVGLYFGIERHGLNYVIARLLSAPITVIWNFASRKFILARTMPNSR